MKKSTLYLLALSFAFISCKESNTAPIIIEHAGSAHYYIVNESNIDLQIVYTLSESLNSRVDSLRIEANSEPEKVLGDGMFGQNPKPTDSFSKLEFYRTTDDKELVFSVDPINNDEWEIVRQEIGESGYGGTDYEFVITDDHIE